MSLNQSALPAAKNAIKTRLINTLLVWEKPLSAAILAALIFTMISSTAGVPWRTTDLPYFNYLADAFLHGQIHLRVIPPFTNDLSMYQGRYYLYWGPFPAIAAMPLVAIFGVRVSDVLQSIVFGGFDVALFAVLLRQMNRRKFVETSPVQRALLVLFFALGSSFTTLPAVGMVWYLAMIEMLFVCLLAYIVAFAFENEAAFFATGCAVGGILISRQSAIFVAVFLAWYLISRHKDLGWRRLLRCCALGLLPVLLTGIAVLAYNQVRFDSVFESGVRYQLTTAGFARDLARYGLFSTHYLEMNFYYTYLYYPMLSLFTNGWIANWGGSILLLGPLFFAALTAIYTERRNPDMWFLLLAFLLGNIPILLLMGPNFQFGSRYSLDFMLPLLVLTVLGMKRWPNRLVAVLVIISVIHYLAGALMYLLFQS